MEVKIVKNDSKITRLKVSTKNVLIRLSSDDESEVKPLLEIAYDLMCRGIGRRMKGVVENNKIIMTDDSYTMSIEYDLAIS